MAGAAELCGAEEAGSAGLRIVVPSCWAYRDTWNPWFALFRKFWPDCPYETLLLTDFMGFPDGELPPNLIPLQFMTGTPWSTMLADYAAHNPHDLSFVFQDDFFLTDTVESGAIGAAIDELQRLNAGMVRLYPMPGANEDYGNARFGLISKGTEYRISCQASIWRNSFLHEIAKRCETPTQFELMGTKHAENLPDAVLAWRREVKPWPVEYLCSAISRSRWNPDAKRICDLHGIEVDWSMRPFSHASGE
jgi:hypothetical protein